jgi:FG-GAP-like repeat
LGPDQSAAAALVSSLPNEPFPFRQGIKPANEIALKQFVQTVEEGKLGEDPSLVDRWRYNLASAALGKATETLPEKLRLNTVLKEETENFPVQLSPKPSELAGPLAIGDFDGVDGLEIISHGGTKMWTSNGEGNLVLKIALDNIISGSSLSPADYDNDGDLDLFVARRHGLPNSLLENDGKGSFTDVTVKCGLLAFSDTAAVQWVDYDLDGLLDLMIGNYDHPFEIYRQTSPGIFKGVSWELDLWRPVPVEKIQVTDLNLDGFPDLFLSIRGQSDQLLYALPTTQSEKWRFREKSAEFKMALTTEPGTFVSFDLENDGDPDVLLGTATGDSEKRISEALNQLDRQPENHLRLFVNNGEGVLTEATVGSGLEGIEDVHDIKMVDLDNDGFEDVLVITGDLASNRALWNRGGVIFRDVSQVSGLSYLNSPIETHIVDLESDGNLDVFLGEKNGTITWLENNKPSSNGWIDLNLTNTPPGSRLKIMARDVDWVLQPIHRWVGLSRKMTIGLGQAEKIEMIEVFPPQTITAVETLKKILPNQTVMISIPEKAPQGDSAVEVIQK